MTATADKPAAEVVDTVTLTIDGTEVTVPKGTLIIRAAEQVGIEIPRFCDHPALKPAGACRQCLVDVASPAGPEGKLRAFPKPQASCTMTVTEGMVVNTQHTSEEADRAQKGVMELLLINHPLDCPVCDKGGECPLQNQAMSHGRPESRFVDVKRVFEKPLALSSEILLDRERCVLCQRCTRFSKEIAGDAFIDLQNRGAQQQIGTFDEDVLDFDGYRPVGAATVDEAGKAFSSYYSGNTVQICPVGALTSAAYRFRSRPFDLVSSPSISEHDSSGSAIRIDHRRGKILRRLAENDPVVNEDWISDKDRFAFAWQNLSDRLTRPLVRKDGELVEASWPEALAAAAAGIKAQTTGDDARGAAVLAGGRVTLEDAYAYQKLARVVLGTNDVDARARTASDEEQAFLGAQVAGTGLGVTFGELEKAPTVVLVGFEPEDEGGVVFLRLRKSLGRQQVVAVAPFLSRGSEKLGATLVPAAPGREAAVLADLPADVREALAQPGAVIVLGERAAEAPGAFAAAQDLASSTGARVAWIPRRAGERGAVEAGALPGLLPGGRAVSVKAARDAVAAAWGVDALPSAKGRDTAGIVKAAAEGTIGALVVGGVSASDLTGDVAAALESAGFVVSLEVRRSEIAEAADVVLPVAPPSEKPGTFVNWEGRLRAFATAIRTDAMSDHRVLDLLAREWGVELGTGTVEAVNAELAALGAAEAAHRPAAAKVKAPARNPRPKKGAAVLATWHQLVDEGALQDGEPYLAGTGRVAVARMSAATAASLGDAVSVEVSTEAGAVELPLVVTEGMVDGVVWVPVKSPGSWVARDLRAAAGAVVSVKGAA
ncbi:NADH-quinone oxidoreductase subunit G [Demequina rhizosphaerae]|uniref:NADH-quinone oxidoreductase subunit G n=1 Tax=Demequina rhizosphaerae TaxID=1638985 RepID=UPI000785BA51|nr:NADH-quinone oxidoreductase subunit G [Demequina rhizosphaerae]